MDFVFNMLKKRPKVVEMRLHSPLELKALVHFNTELNLDTSLELVMGKEVQGSSKYNHQRPNEIVLAF